MIWILFTALKVISGILLALIAIMLVNDFFWYLNAKYYINQGIPLRYFPGMGFIGYAKSPKSDDGLERYRKLFLKPNDPNQSEPAIVINGVGTDPIVMLNDKELIKKYHKVESEVTCSQNIQRFPFTKAFVFGHSKKAIMNRGIFAEIFYPDNLRKHAPAIKAIIDRHLQNIKQRVATERVDGVAEIELRDHIKAIFSDVVGFILFGEEIPKIDGRKLTDQLEDNFNGYFENRISLPYLLTAGYYYDIFPSAHYKQILDMHKKIEEVIKANVKKRTETRSYEGGINVVDLLIANNAKKEAEGKIDQKMSLQEMIDNIYMVIFAGLDTSKNLTQNCLTILSHSQDFQKPLREDVMAKIFNKNLQNDYDAYDTSVKLSRFVTETLRVYSPVWAGMMHKAIKNFKIGDYHIKKGTVMMVSFLTLQSKPEYFENPLKFDLEKYTKNKDIKELSRHAIIPFSAGKRACIGKNLAEIVVKMIVSSVLRQFELTASEVPNRRFMKPNYSLEHCRAKVRCIGA